MERMEKMEKMEEIFPYLHTKKKESKITNNNLYMGKDNLLVNKPISGNKCVSETENFIGAFRGPRK